MAERYIFCSTTTTTAIALPNDVSNSLAPRSKSLLLSPALSLRSPARPAYTIVNLAARASRSQEVSFCIGSNLSVRLSVALLHPICFTYRDIFFLSLVSI